MAFLVYLKRNGRVEAQTFDEWPIVGGKPITVVQQHEITQDDMRCNLSFLIRKYPYRADEDLT